MSDVDLLLQRGDLPAVEEILYARGYQGDNPNRSIWAGNHHFSYHHQVHGLMVEVHWLLFNPNTKIKIDHATVWKRAVPTTLAEKPAFVMGLTEMIPYLCAHIANHWQFTNLRMFIDVAEVVVSHSPDIDWDLLKKNIIAWQLERPCYLVLRLCQDLLGLNLPDSWLEDLQPVDFTDALYASAKEHILETVSKGEIMRSASLAVLGQPIRFDQKLLQILRQFFPSRRILSNRYPVRINSWRIYFYYPKRWVDLVGKYSRIGWELLRRKPRAKNQADGTRKALQLKNWLLPDKVVFDEQKF
jgi:hypothetical protein